MASRLVRQAEDLAAELGVDTKAHVVRGRSSPGEGIVSAARAAEADLIVLGAHARRLEGRPYLGANVEHVLAIEALCAARERRPRRALYHAALIVELGERYAIEVAPSPDGDEASRGVVATGAVGSRLLGRWRLFRYEVRCWPSGRVPDLAYAVGGPSRITDDPRAARRLLEVAGTAPTPVWGRDELRAGEMWNSNSLVAWLLASSGLPAQTLRREQGRSWFYVAVASPVLDFLERYRWHAVLLLALIATYRISDIVLGVMSNPFYRDMGFTKDEVAAVSGVYGVLMTLAGAALGGVLALRHGVMRILMLGAALSALTNLLFAWLATRGHDLPALVFAISADNLSAGIASAAFVAYLSGLTNVAYSATQYALFSSVMLLLPKFIGGWSGLAVDSYGYTAFFIGTAALGVPVLVLVWLASRAAARPPAPSGGA